MLEGITEITNQITVQGKISARENTRFTPAGVPIVEAWLEHQSRQIEAEVERDVKFMCRIIAVGEQAAWLAAAPLNSLIVISGFLAAREKNPKVTSLHLRRIQFLEVN